MLKNLGALRRAEAERCSPRCVGEQGTDKGDDLPEDTATTVAVYKRLAAGLRLDELEELCQLLARLRRAIEQVENNDKVETRSAGVGPDEPHHHDAVRCPRIAVRCSAAVGAAGRAKVWQCGPLRWGL